MPPKRNAPHPRAVCVYCASGPTHPELLALAAELGEAIAERGWTLVWGGGNVSAMGALATAARARGGWTVGVIPKMLVRREVADHAAPRQPFDQRRRWHVAAQRRSRVCHAHSSIDEWQHDARRDGQHSR